MVSDVAEFRMLPVRDIELDLQNPRISRVIEMYGSEVTAEQISLALEVGAGRSGSEAGGSNTSYLSLRDSIKTYGGIIHPIIVNYCSEDKVTVIEGNTRVQIFREFGLSDKDGIWDAIPAMVYKNLHQNQIDAIRLQAHLVGPRDWDPYSKAKYLHYLYTQEYLTLNQIVDYCGGNKLDVNNYIHAYIDMESFYRPLIESDDFFDHRKFSGFIELQKTSVINALLSHGFTKSTFAQWIIDGKMGRLENVRQLPRVLNNKKSKEVFIKEDMDEALKVLIMPASGTSLVDATLEQLAQELSKRVLLITWPQLNKLKSDTYSESRDILINTRDTVMNFCKELETEE